MSPAPYRGGRLRAWTWLLALPPAWSWKASPSQSAAATGRVGRRIAAASVVGAISRLNHTAGWIARPLDRLDLELAPGRRDFYSGASLDESPSSTVRYDYGAA